jgi:hypothetical protein
VTDFDRVFNSTILYMLKPKSVTDRMRFSVVLVSPALLIRLHSVLFMRGGKYKKILY